MMIENDPHTIHASVHDQSQIELDIDYHLGIESNLYDVDLYFFFPSSMGVTSSAYSRDQFFNDLTNHFRFHTPKDDNPDIILLQDLDNYFGHDQSLNEKETKKPYLLQQVKLFGNRINTRLKALQSWSASGHDEHFIVAEALRLRTEIEYFRKEYVAQVKHPLLAVDPAIRGALLNVDEYLLNRFVSSFSELHKKVSGSNSKEKLLAALTAEAEYRRTNGANYVDQKKTEADREYFNYRSGLLKKFVSSPLYIQKKRSRQDRIYRNWVAGCGAAMAGLWAQIADFQAKRMAHSKDLGLNFFAIALLAIFIYVFKDRIKDLSKEYFTDRLKSYLPDYKVKLEHQMVAANFRPLKIKLGSYEEYVSYFPATKAPAEIQFIRKLRGRRDIGEESSETILHYHKGLELHSEVLAKDLPGVRSVKDIMRVNFSYFLSHLDDPLKNLSIFDEEEGPSSIETPKVYHVNLILKATKREPNGHARLAHYRLIIDKKGITRLEDVTPPNVFSYMEYSA